jgi:hypothetical protein
MVGMTTVTEFFSPSDSVDPSKVRRSKDGRPYVKRPCPDGLRSGCEEGYIEGKRAGTKKQCPKCKGKGYVEKLYHRASSFGDLLYDRRNLEKWKLRIVLTGLGVKKGLLASLERTSPDDKEMLNAIADEAFELGDGYAKAQKGTDLHTLTEYVDKGWPLPEALVDPVTGQERPVTLQDRADLAAWQRVTEALSGATEGSERFVVQDEYEIGGTYDRKVSLGQRFCECGGSLVLDLKTGRIDYGAGKIAQQLAIYANSKDYDPATGERIDQYVCTHYGIIVHLPQGTGEATVHVVDLVAGWEAVKLSSQVREHRRMSKNMLWPLEKHAELTQ